jgi:dihydropyrimidinase
MLRCWPEHTLSRGRTVWRDGAFTGKAGDGEFVKCQRPREPVAGSPLAKWL